MEEIRLTVRSNRKVIFLQALAIVLFFGLLGWLLQSWDFLRTSIAGKFDKATDLPVIAIVAFGVGLMIAILIFRDDWNFRVVFRKDHLCIYDRVGVLRAFYNNLKKVKVIPHYGAGIAFKDFEHFVQTLEEQNSAREKIRARAEITTKPLGCEFCILSKNLDIGAENFVNEVNKRIENWTKMNI